jgi:hypothetical protein
MKRFAIFLGAAAGLALLSGCAYDDGYYDGYGYNGGYYDNGYDGGASVGVYYNDRDRDYRDRNYRDRYRNYYGRRGYR